MGVMETTCAACGAWFYPMTNGKLCDGNRCYRTNIIEDQKLARRIAKWLMRL